MCYYRLYLYSVCGHFQWGKFLAYCKEAARHAYLAQQSQCTARQRHPYQTLRIHTLCLMCVRERERSERLLNTSKIGDNIKGIEPTFLRKNTFTLPLSPKRRSLNSLRKEMKAEMLRQRAGSETRSLQLERVVPWSSSPLRRSSLDMHQPGREGDGGADVAELGTVLEVHGVDKDVSKEGMASEQETSVSHGMENECPTSTLSTTNV